MIRTIFSAVLLSIAVSHSAIAVTMDVNQGSSVDTTDDTPTNNDLMVMGGAGSPPTFLVNVNSATKADYFGATPYASLGCSDLSGLSFNPGNFLPEPGDIFFVQDGTRYAKVRFNSVNPGVSINLTWDALGSCSADPPPVSSFTFTTYDLIGFFTDTSTNSPSGWSWDFGGAGNSTQQNPSFFFPNASTFSVALTASNTATGSTDTQDVTLTERPSETRNVGQGFDFDGDSLNDLLLIAPDGCGGNATFSMANGATYASSGTDYRGIDVTDIPGAISGSGNFCVTEGVSGLFDAFFIQNSDGSVAKFWGPEISAADARIEFELLTVVLPPPPTTSWTFSTYDLIAFFTDTSTGDPGSWTWDFGDSTGSSTQNPSHFYASGATYTASLTASNTGGDGATVPMDVTVAERPSITPGVGTAVDFDGDGVDDLGVIAPDGCGGDVTLSVLNGATWASPGGDYRTVAAPGTIDSTSNFCATEGVAGLFDPRIVQTAIGSIVKFWVPEVDAAGLRMEFELLTLITAPDAPTGILGTPADGAALIDFDAPASDGGSPIIDYTADCGAGSATTVTSDAETITVSGLTNGVTYSCTVTARNAAGTSAPSAPVDVTPVALTDLSVTKTDSADPIVAGSTLTYTVTVTNNGPDVATGVVATDTLPGGMSLQATSGCAEDPAGVPTCTLGTIAASASMQYTIEVVLDANLPTGTLTNTVVVSADSTDGNAANDSASEATNVTEQMADLAFTVDSNAPDPVELGTTFDMLLTATNNGPQDATGVVATITLPAGLAFVQAGGAGCPDHADGIVTWTIGALAVSAVETCSFEVRVLENGVLQVSADIAGDQSDPDPSNNGIVTAVIRGAVLVIPTLGGYGLVALMLAMLAVGMGWRRRSRGV